MRHGWQVDLKWMFGLACLFVALAAGFVYSLRTVTAHDTATAIYAAALSGYASGHVSDEEWAQISAAAQANPGAEFTLPGLAVPLKGSVIAGVDKDGAVELAALEIAEVNYSEGPEAAQALITLPGEDGESFDPGPLGGLSQSTHDAFRPYLTIFALLTIPLAALVVAFSKGFGRAGSVGVVAVLGATPFALLWTLISSRAGGASPESGRFAYSLAQAFVGPAGEIATTFTRVAIAGGVLVIGSVAGNFAADVIRRQIGVNAAARVRSKESGDRSQETAAAATEASTDSVAAPEIGGIGLAAPPRLSGPQA